MQQQQQQWQQQMQQQQQCLPLGLASMLLLQQGCGGRAGLQRLPAAAVGLLGGVAVC
jgi:hypothetical protein